jgi:acetyl-CoA synthetase
VALRCLRESGATRELTYGELAEQSSRCASALRSLGVRRGDRVFIMTGRIPELYVAVLGGLKLGAVVCTLAAFGPEPIAQRLRLGDGRVLVTTPELYDRKVAASRDGLPVLQHVLLTGDPATVTMRPGPGRTPRSASDMIRSSGKGRRTRGCCLIDTPICDTQSDANQ